MPTGTPSSPSVRLNVEALEDRTVLSSFGGRGGLSIEFANIINTTGAPEYITGTGPGVRAQVRIWDTSGNLLTSFFPFGGFTGGVFVKTGNVDSDNDLELIVSTAAGTVGRVKVYEFGFGGLQTVARFIPFGPNFFGGVEAAAGNVTGGREQEIIVGQQSLGGQVKVYAAAPAPVGTGTQFVPIRSFLPFGPRYIGGVSLGSANLDATANSLFDPYNYNYAEVVVGKASFEPRIKIFDVQEPTAVKRAAYMAFDTRFTANRNGVNVEVGSTDGLRGAEVYVAIKGSSRVRFFSGQTGIMLGEIFPFITSNSRMTNMAINENDDDIFNIYSVANLIVVAADGRFAQVPIVYPGQVGSPAGLNGRFPAA